MSEIFQMKLNSIESTHSIEDGLNEKKREKKLNISRFCCCFFWVFEVSAVAVIVV